ncbi:hypothetical protein [Metabacillus idriensis]|uniref:hypothetical protein n=1 Tax=Metabacillus idriensis TaxID=324768 RepID=UPI003D270AD3
MVKCLTALVLMISLVFTPVGDSMMEKHTSYVSAKSFKGGKRRYNPNSNYNQPDAPRSNFRNSRANPARGGIMRGLLYGGIAGLLLGSMLGHLGLLGGILGLLINLFALFLIILVIRKVFRLFVHTSK